MSNIYDNWERLVSAVIKREEFRELARAPSRESSLSSISTDFSARFSFSSIPDHFPDPEASSSSSIPFYRRDSTGENHLPDVMPISFNELKNAAGFFLADSFLGKGGLGPIFKGWIDTKTLTAAEPGSGKPVAIRKWNGMPRERLMKLMQLHHPNLIKLVAYCNEGDDLFLVYEFMPKGSLFDQLFTGRQPLSWVTRIKVAIGAAEGLHFLHDAKNKVTHRNLKSSNILLDEEFNAKLSDFGCAKEVSIPYETPTGISYVAWNYIGYAAPEHHGHWTEKCDVYAFGVVLLELLTGRRATDRRQKLVDWAKPYLSVERVFRIMDPQLKGNYPEDGAKKFAALAALCSSSQREDRPSLEIVLKVLKREASSAGITV